MKKKEETEAIKYVKYLMTKYNFEGGEIIDLCFLESRYESPRIYTQYCPTITTKQRGTTIVVEVEYEDE